MRKWVPVCLGRWVWLKFLTASIWLEFSELDRVFPPILIWPLTLRWHFLYVCTHCNVQKEPSTRVDRVWPKAGKCSVHRSGLLFTNRTFTIAVCMIHRFGNWIRIYRLNSRASYFLSYVSVRNNRIVIPFNTWTKRSFFFFLIYLQLAIAVV